MNKPANGYLSRFYSTKQRNQGTGLGLSVVYGIISSHFGFVEVESEPGNGTSFSLYFPKPKTRKK